MKNKTAKLYWKQKGFRNKFGLVRLMSERLLPAKILLVIMKILIYQFVFVKMELRYPHDNVQPRCIDSPDWNKWKMN